MQDRSLLTEEVTFEVVENAAAAGLTTLNSDGVLMEGKSGVVFAVAIGAITSTGTVTAYAEQSDDDGSTDAYSQLAGTTVTVNDQNSNRLILVEVKKPTKKYVRCTVTRATANSVINGIFAVSYGPSRAPVTQPADVAGRTTAVSPAEA